MSTPEYWTRYTFLLLMGPENIQIEELLQITDPLDGQENLQRKIAKAKFVTVLEDKAVKIMQNRKPEDKVLEKDLKCIEQLWEETRNTDNNQNHQLIQLLIAKREFSESISDFWNQLGKLATK